MIREMQPDDIEEVGQVWLAASIQAHDFVAEEFWRSELTTMTSEILPHPRTEAYVFETEGQIEGFVEKYGMEYARAYHDETVDERLVARHERQIFPLMRRRHLFSQVHEFVLYDVIDDGGSVCEDIFAYSNRAGDDRAIVVYNNRYGESAGWIRQGAPTRRGGTDAPLVEPTLGDALGIEPDTGLIGMRERVEVYGGELATHPMTGGGYRVRAVLPIEADPRPAATTADTHPTGSRS